MDLGDQPPVRRADIVAARPFAQAEQYTRLGGSHCRARRRLPPPPEIDEACEDQADNQLAHYPAIAWRGASSPGSGKANPATISRSSWRAAMCDMATSSISLRSSRVSPLGNS